MSIVAAELIWRKPAEVSDASTNGGRMTSTVIPSGVKNNIWPDVPQSERTAGSTKYRKVFIHAANDSDLTLIAPRVFVFSPTPGDDRVAIFPATQSNQQSAITGAEQKYGAGTLNATVSAAATTITVLVEAAADALFVAGMKVRISDKQTINGSGNEEYRTISGSAPTYVGNVCTFTITAGLTNGYSNATPTYVSGVYEPGDVKATVSNWVETGSGTYDESGYPVGLDSIASIEQTWTLTFTDATHYSLSGNTVGSVVASQSIGSNFSPPNADYSNKPYFTLLAAGFGGTWTTNNTIVFQTHPASIPLWYKRVIPAGANSLSGNKVIVAIDGESA